MEPLAEWVGQNRLVSILCAVGLVLAGIGGVFYLKTQSPVEVQILDDPKTLGAETTKIQVDVQGEVLKPGVYVLDSEARIKDAIAEAGGMSANADRIWVARYVNLAQRVVDGAKIYIPAESSAGISNDKFLISNQGQSSNVKMININTASQAELDALTGIGEKRAEAIMAGRPYGDIGELVTKKILTQGVFDKIKAEISVY